jgi:hypothetical protein
LYQLFQMCQGARGISLAPSLVAPIFQLQLKRLIFNFAVQCYLLLRRPEHATGFGRKSTCGRPWCWATVLRARTVAENISQISLKLVTFEFLPGKMDPGKDNRSRRAQRAQRVAAFLCVLCALCGFSNQKIIKSPIGIQENH